MIPDIIAVGIEWALAYAVAKGGTNMKFLTATVFMVFNVVVVFVLFALNGFRMQKAAAVRPPR